MRGKAPTHQVSRVARNTPDRICVVKPPLPTRVGDLVLDPPLPFRLQGESEQTWHFDAEHVREVAQAFAEAMPDRSFRAVRGRAQIGGRKRLVVSENEAEIPHIPEAP